ncbi:(Fe-S)-binding protein [Pseudobacter ginsenosidimutans]|uniref:L-lactate dehydrogenase complex protein LldE n=1 Tax=Pseudobacter ginsenosidimutans TaxID=661488 RepID=A0A4V2F1S5_9BACT|nr:(Fe-S)-binding protein [Pseudobacter ginsenosidimutans]QEC43421.1 (Fe-S)-binding protein [Pseudobacter ginsenosidimutans]RZS74796.1 L-lactate dehydrogenase complex protein LldE [Pseudobacter ginsenosidimutans]
MRVALFVPCYVDQFYPNVAIATFRLLTELGVDIEFPSGQTCCGQPMANGGFEDYTKGCNRNFVENFSGYDYIVSPSGSCVLHVKDHLHDEKVEATATTIRQRVYELCEFLTDVLKVTALNSCFSGKVALHQGCHGQRGLQLGSSSERMLPCFSKPLQLLQLVQGIEMVPLNRGDECCGFGGTFCVTEEAVSVAMGNSKLNDYRLNGAEVLTGTDMSCLMHQEGLIRRQQLPIRVMHIAEILAGEEK